VSTHASSDVTAPDTGGSGPAGPGGAGLTGRVRPWRRPRLLIWLGIAACLLGALVVAADWFFTGLSYQPLTNAGSGPDLLGSIVHRPVNNFGMYEGEIWVPEQKPATGALYMSLQNTGKQPVTIESIGENFPGSAGVHVLTGTGPATYTDFFGPQPPVSRWKKLAGSVLLPGGADLIRIPVRLTRCWIRGESYVQFGGFRVTMKYGWWTHQVWISWPGPPILAHAGSQFPPAAQSEPVCLSGSPS
jgi:hypothetical protein